MNKVAARPRIDSQSRSRYHENRTWEVLTPQHSHHECADERSAEFTEHELRGEPETEGGRERIPTEVGLLERCRQGRGRMSNRYWHYRDSDRGRDPSTRDDPPTDNPMDERAGHPGWGRDLSLRWCHVYTHGTLLYLVVSASQTHHRCSFSAQESGRAYLDDHTRRGSTYACGRLTARHAHALLRGKLSQALAPK